MGVLYFIFVHYQFRAHNTWYPISVPFTQVFLVVVITPVWKYVASNRAVKNFLHHEVFQKIERGEDLKKLKSGSQKIYGTCLITDIDGYTKISEAIEPEELNRVMNKYFETIFMQLKKHNVSIKKTIGDSILAAWKGNSEDVTQCHACISALDIENRVNQFNQSSDIKLPTRIGLHCGNMSLGMVGGIDHYEYDIGGDTVNTTKRIEESNKILGTRILLSEEVFNQAYGFLTREVGKFMLSGKSRPLVLHELICPLEESTQEQKDLSMFFSWALADFKRRLWKEADEKFCTIINRYGKDGPSVFYKKLCELYLENPPGNSWDGAICFDNN
jgi:adenylate cyclase